jgi:Tfp pilus assembly protein PilN
MIAINLIPGPIQVARVRRIRVRRWLMAVGASVVAVLIPFASDQAQQAHQRRLSSEQAELMNKLEVLRVEVKRLSTDAQMALLQLERAAALRSKRAWSGMLELIATTLPPDCWLSAVATEPAMPPSVAGGRVVSSVGPPGTKPAASVPIESPRKLKLTGHSVDPASPHTFARRLREQGVFSHVSVMQGAKESAMDGQYFRFQLECEW